MRFLLSVIDSRTGTATTDEMDSIRAFNDRLRAGGHRVLAAGLASPDQSTLIDNRAGASVVRDGPLVDGPEYVSGLWIIDAPDHETALALAMEGSEACNRRIEVRSFLE
jgi:hypothetical protein